jgi:hypothetical protein
MAPENSKITAAIDEAAIREFVTKRFIAEGKDSTVKEIADGMGVNEARVRKIINDNNFNRDGWATHYQDTRSNKSSNYGAFVGAGIHKVWFYGPSRRYMAQIVKERA